MCSFNVIEESHAGHKGHHSKAHDTCATSWPGPSWGTVQGPPAQEDAELMDGISLKRHHRALHFCHIGTQQEDSCAQAGNWDFT